MLSLINQSCPLPINHSFSQQMKISHQEILDAMIETDLDMEDHNSLDYSQAQAKPNISFVEEEGPFKQGIKGIQNNTDGSMTISFDRVVNKRMPEVIEQLFPGAEISSERYVPVENKMRSKPSYNMTYYIKTPIGERFSLSYPVMFFPWNTQLNVKKL